MNKLIKTALLVSSLFVLNACIGDLGNLGDNRTTSTSFNIKVVSIDISGPNGAIDLETSDIASAATLKK